MSNGTNKRSSVRVPLTPNHIKTINDVDLLNKALEYIAPHYNQAQDGWWDYSFNYLPQTENFNRAFMFDGDVKDITNALESRLRHLNSLNNRDNLGNHAPQGYIFPGNSIPLSDRRVSYPEDKPNYIKGGVVQKVGVSPAELPTNVPVSTPVNNTPNGTTNRPTQGVNTDKKAVPTTTPVTNTVGPFNFLSGMTGNTSSYAPLDRIDGSAPIFNGLNTPTINNTGSSTHLSNTMPDNTISTGKDPNNVLGDVLSRINGMVSGSGDVLSMLGTINGMQDAEALTREHFSTSKPNENFYKDFGKAGLAELDASGNYLDRTKVNQENNLHRQQAVHNANLAQNVRSSNVANVMKQASHASSLEGLKDINNAVDSQRLSLSNNKANLLNQIDQMIRQGAQQKDIADRQDIGTFYTNLSQNKMDYNRGLQHLGSMINQRKLNEVTNNLLSQLSHYGFAIDSNTGQLYKR